MNIELEDVENIGCDLKCIIPTLLRATEEDHNNRTVSRTADLGFNPTQILFSLPFLKQINK